MNLFDQTSPATVEGVTWLRRAVRREFECLNIAVDLGNELLLAIAELATNIVAHASPPASTIRLSIDLMGASLRVTLEDDGAEFKEFDATWRSAARKELAATDVHGLGLALAHTCLTNVSYLPGSPNVLTAWRPIVRTRPTVLILEDDPTLLKLYSVLMSRTCRVLGASDIDTALALATTHTVDLILCDYHVRESNGTSLLSELERDAGRLPIPIIMMSSDDQYAIRTHAFSFGIEAFLRKPIKPSDLTSAVERGLASANRRMTGLFRYFGASTEKLLDPPADDVLSRDGIGLRQGAATFGGGDFILRFSMAARDRTILTDMMGHGLQAKVASIALASAMRTLQTTTPPTPGSYLTALSTIVGSDPALSGLMATAIVVDRLQDGRFQVAASGHPAPIILSETSATRVSAMGPLLGFMSEYLFTDVDVDLSTDERMLLVSDGVDPVQLASGGPVPADLIAVLRAHASADLPNAIEAAGQWARTNLGPHPRDDWTIMLLGPRGKLG